MYRKTCLVNYGIEEDIDPTIKFNSLLSVAVSTVMCLAARCPLPKSNIETTKLFLSTITDETGNIPRNIRDFLSLLDDYSGPYECDSLKERRFDTSPVEKLLPVKEEEPSQESVASPGAVVPAKEPSPGTESHGFANRNSKIAIRKGDSPPPKKGIKNVASKIATSKSFLSNKL